MLSLSGSYEIKIDDKWRMRVPSKHKDKLAGSNLKITISTAGCLQIMPEETLATIWRNYKSDLNPPQAVKDYMRVFSGKTFDIEEDPQGRFVIPTTLRDKLDIETSTLCIGFDDRIELWPMSKWENKMSANDNNLMMDTLAKYDI